MLIEPDELRSKLGQGNLVLLHVGSEADFNAGHIPGAQLITLADVSVTGPNGLRLELPDEEQLRSELLRRGIGDTAEVVIYSGNESFQSATRVWFTFDYLSLPARFLNGGLPYWKAQGLPLSQQSSAARPATKLTTRVRPELLAEAAEIAAKRGKYDFVLIDARLPQYYSGADAGIMQRAGRIPGARNVPFEGFFTEDKRWISADSMQSKLGASEDVVVYCHIGMQATVPYFAARLAGKKVRLYDGSYQDWSMRSELPVEKD